MKETFNPPRPDYRHYSQVVKKGKMVFLTGMVPHGPDGQLVGDDIRSQTGQCLENMRMAMEAAGGSLDDVCYVTGYLWRRSGTSTTTTTSTASSFLPTNLRGRHWGSSSTTCLWNASDRDAGLTDNRPVALKLGSPPGVGATRRSQRSKATADSIGRRILGSPRRQEAQR